MTLVTPPGILKAADSVIACIPWELVGADDVVEAVGDVVVTIAGAALAVLLEGEVVVA